MIKKFAEFIEESYGKELPMIYMNISVQTDKYINNVCN